MGYLRLSATKVCAELDCADKRVDLVVLPELSSIDYSRDTFGHLDEIAEPLDGASFQMWLDHEAQTKAPIIGST